MKGSSGGGAHAAALSLALAATGERWPTMCAAFGSRCVWRHGGAEERSWTHIRSAPGQISSRAGDQSQLHLWPECGRRRRAPDRRGGGWGERYLCKLLLGASRLRASASTYGAVKKL